ncbi:MAG: peroxiredoxin, partial [Litoreibacter sp.]|nr:peroxiredoxin [Litoreibacter sp.]
GFLENDDLQTIDAEKVFKSERIVTIGVPGAFTPVCTKQHIPDFIRNATELKQSGFSKLICLASNDPFVLDEWARQLDPHRQIQFLSDGNLEFARALGVTSKMPSLLVGERSERFMMITWNGLIEHFRIEPNVLTFSCTRADDALQFAHDYVDV